MNNDELSQKSETYQEFEARLLKQGYKRKRFQTYDPVAFTRALHRWFNPHTYILYPDIWHPEYRNEVWYKEIQ